MTNSPVTYTLEEFTGANTQSQITLTENNGSITVQVDVVPDPISGYIGDLGGVFFHINESLLGSLSITDVAGNITAQNLGGPANTVSRVGHAVINPAAFDIGVSIGEAGLKGGRDDFREATFTVSSTTGALSIADFEGFGVRLTSVGLEGGPRELSSKLISGDNPELPDEIPGIRIDKVTSNFSVEGDGLVIQEGNNIEWIYRVNNDGNVALSNITVTDDKEVNIEFIGGDDNGNSLLDLEEVWTYKASGVSVLGSYENIGTATGDFGSETVDDSDDSSYTGVVVAGARTPGFWKNWKQAWDGDASNDSRFVSRENFAQGDLLLAPYTAATIDPVTGEETVGLLIGDYNRNGVTDAGENTIFYSLEEAHQLVDASKKEDRDARFILGRSMVATWLNFLAANPTPITDLNDGIRWMQSYTADENGDGKGDGNVFNGGAISASSDAWSGDLEGVRNGAEINAALDFYNNTGTFGVQELV